MLYSGKEDAQLRNVKEPDVKSFGNFQGSSKMSEQESSRRISELQKQLSYHLDQAALINNELKELFLRSAPSSTSKQPSQKPIEDDRSDQDQASSEVQSSEVPNQDASSQEQPSEVPSEVEQALETIIDLNTSADSQSEPSAASAPASEPSAVSAPASAPEAPPPLRCLRSITCTKEPGHRGACNNTPRVKSKRVKASNQGDTQRQTSELLHIATLKMMCRK